MLLANKKFTLKAIADKLEVSYKTIKNINAEFKKGQRTRSGSPPRPRVGDCLKQNTSIKIEEYLSDTFSLYPEREDTEKIPINTITFRATIFI